jgi:hypothetical protein
VFEGTVTEQYDTRAPGNEWPHLSWTIDAAGRDIAKKLSDVLEGDVGEGIDINATVWEEILAKASYATLRLEYYNDTTHEVLYLSPENGTSVEDTLRRIAYVLVKDVGIVVYTPYVDGSGVHYVIIKTNTNTQPSNILFDSRNYGIIVGNDSDKDYRPKSALNFTLELDFYSDSGEWLFSIRWQTNYTDYDVEFNRWIAAEYISVVKPVLRLGNTRATLGFDKPSGWWQPEDTLVVDEDSWFVDGGRAAVYGVTVYYEAQEGALFDSLPIEIGFRVLETG